MAVFRFEFGRFCSLPDLVDLILPSLVSKEIYHIWLIFMVSKIPILVPKPTSRRSLPQYYDVIDSPIDLMKIQQKLKTDEYKTVTSFIGDVKLLLFNAQSFYQWTSEEFRNAVALEQAFLQKLEELVEGEGLLGSVIVYCRRVGAL